jgi:hypothetical protein
MPPPDEEPQGWQQVAGIRLLVVFLLFLFVVMVIGLIKGVPGILHQHEALTTWKSVEAQVISADSSLELPPEGMQARLCHEILNGILGEDHLVWVSYRYKVDGKLYESGKKWPGVRLYDLLFNKPHPSGESWTGLVGAFPWASVAGKETWARKTLAGFVPGEPCVAYFDPNDPAESFLLKEYAFTPYGLTLFSLLLVLFLPAFARSYSRSGGIVPTLFVAFPCLSGSG